MKQRLKDPDLARLFENTFPSTLDTTVKYFDPKANLAFIITGVGACIHWIPRASFTNAQSNHRILRMQLSMIVCLMPTDML